MTQWRPFIFVIVGFAIIYLASLLQDPPFIRPKALHIADRPYFVRKPDDIILSAAGPYLYMSAIWREGEYPEKNGVKRGTGNHAIGVRGRVKQYRAPLELFRSNSHVVEADAGWEEMFQDDLNGRISHVSKYPDQVSDPNAPMKSYFSILYQEIEGEDVKNIARVYYLSMPSDGSLEYDRFHYKELVIPGSTWISAFDLEEGMLIYTRDPDQYYFRTTPLPLDIYSPPHDDEAKRIIAPPGTEGKLMKGKTQPFEFADYNTMIVRLYSPQENTLRVAALRTFKLSDGATLNVTIMDNATMTDASASQQKLPVNNWILRERADMVHQPQNDEDYSPITDNPYYQPERIIKMPKIAAARSASLKTFMYPYKNYMMSIDYIDDFSLLELDSKWTKVVDLWTSQTKGKLVGGVFVDSHFSKEIVIPHVDGNYDQEFAGVQLNADGNICAAWSDYNNIFLYKRGFADPDRPSQRLFAPEGSEEGVNQISPAITKVLDMRWNSPWAITWFPEHSRSVSVATLEIWNATRPLDVTPNNILLVAMKDGRVHSFALDYAEEQPPIGLKSFITQRWDMLIVMLGTILVFVINEVKNHPSV